MDHMGGASQVWGLMFLSIFTLPVFCCSSVEFNETREKGKLYGFKHLEEKEDNAYNAQSIKFHSNSFELTN